MDNSITVPDEVLTRQEAIERLDRLSPDEDFNTEIIHLFTHLAKGMSISSAYTKAIDMGVKACQTNYSAGGSQQPVKFDLQKVQIHDVLREGDGKFSNGHFTDPDEYC